MFTGACIVCNKDYAEQRNVNKTKLPISRSIQINQRDRSHTEIISTLGLKWSVI